MECGGDEIDKKSLGVDLFHSLIGGESCSADVYQKGENGDDDDLICGRMARGRDSAFVSGRRNAA